MSELRIALIALWALGSGALAQEPLRPNILLITVDTFRADHIGYYGYPLDTSPHLDTLASEGAFFKQAFSSSGWTTPGLISILTSLYEPTHAVDIRGRRLAPGIETLADALRRVGYRAPDIFFLTEIPNFENLGFESYPRRNELIDDGDEILFHWLEHEAEQDAAPFFLYYHYRDLHLPYAAGEPYESMFLPGAFVSSLPGWGALKRFIAREKIEIVKKNVMIARGNIDFAPRDRRWIEALYDAEIRRLDSEFFARLRRTLVATGLDANTIVVVSADHGEELLDRDLVGHISTYQEARLYDEVIRIPLLVRWPGRLPGGRVIDEPVQCIDIMPTLLELAGAPAPLGMQGQSLLPLIEGGKWTPKPLFFASSSGGYTADADEYQRRIHAVRTARWKLIDNVWEGSRELYDLAADPLERADAASRYPQVADSLQALLNEWVLYAAPRMPADTTAAPPPLAEAWDEPLEIRYPQTGDTLHWQGAEHAIKLEWTGPSHAEYAIEYDVGIGTYHLSGEITAPNSAPVYGPFQANFWNSLVLYNPWKFRVYLPGRPETKSEWVEFNLAATGDGEPEFSWRLWLLQVPAALGAVADHAYKLGLGLGRGVGDFYLMAISIGAADLSAYALLLALAWALSEPVRQRLGPERWRAWGIAVGYIAFVYCTIPLLPDVWAALAGYTEGSIRYLGIALVVLAGCGLAVAIWRRGRWRALVALAGIAPVYGYLLHVYARFPAERLHLVEYGFMGYVLLRALRLDMGRAWAYVASFVLAVLIGIGDECIQWALPQRFFEVKDIQLNALSVALGLLLARVVGGAEDGDDRA